MREAKGNIFQVDCDAVCITTNGFIKGNGEAVMGRGCAKAAAEMVPELPRILGQKLLKNGNHVHLLMEQNGVKLLSFPVKPVNTKFDGDNTVKHVRHLYKIGDSVPGWAAKADLEIIERSVYELTNWATSNHWKNVVLPRPGCGAGELNWENQVRPLLAEILDDRFICMTF